MSTTIISPGQQGSSYVEWGAVIAGTVMACAVSLVLVQFGNSIGLAASRFEHDNHITSMKVMAIGIWLLWVQLMSAASGGYLAGRMRAPWMNSGHESEMRDGAHGLLVWATSSLVAAVAVAVGAFFSMLVAQHSGNAAPPVSIDVDMSHRASVILAFGLAAGYVVSAVAAWVMGTIGGDHRDRAVDVSTYVSFRRKK